jgi:hypothetical protein
MLTGLKGKLPAQTTEKMIIFSSSMSNSLVQNFILFNLHTNTLWLVASSAKVLQSTWDKSSNIFFHKSQILSMWTVLSSTTLKSRAQESEILKLLILQDFHPCMVLQPLLSPILPQEAPPLLSLACFLYPHIPRICSASLWMTSHLVFGFPTVLATEASFRVSQQNFFLRDKVVDLICNPKPGWQVYLFSSGPSPLTCPAWDTLPVATLLPA